MIASSMRSGGGAGSPRRSSRATKAAHDQPSAIATWAAENRPEFNDEVHVERENTPATQARSRLWLWFVAAFLLQAAAWTIWLVIASQHEVQEVPLAILSPK